MTIGESLKRFRSEYKLSQAQVAEKVGMIQQGYYKYESGKNEPPAKFIVKLANVFNVSTDYLLGLSDDPRPLYKAAEEKPAADSELTLEKLQAQIDELKAIVSNQTFNERLNLSQSELKIFAQEVADMVKEGKPVDVGRAIRNAQYLAEIDRRAANVEAGKNVVSFTAEEWEKFNEGSV